MITSLQSVLPHLRPSERRLADYVLAAPREVVHLNMTELADRAQSSQPTIARLCKTLGLSGFKEFKIRLAQSLPAGVAYVHEDVQADESVSGIAGKVIDRTIAALQNVRDSLSSDAVGEAINLLAGARRIEFYGAGGSGLVAHDVQHKFFRLGMPTVAYVDPHVYCVSATLLGAGDAVVAISNTGRSREMLEAATLARAAGATVIAITRSHSPLAALATVAIGVDVNEDPDVYTPMRSRIGHLAVCDILAVGVALQRGPEYVDTLVRSKAVTRRRRDDA